LQLRLGPLLPERAVSDALLPLVIHVDEMVTTRLAPDDAASWPLLQQQNFGVDAGGDLFYRLADRRLAAPAAAPLTVEVLLFCLQSGFLGRASEDPDLVAGYRRRLAEALPETTLPAIAAPPVLRPSVGTSSGAGYYVATIVLIVVLPFLALVASRP
jgi:type VI secretion system protein ImpK